MATTSSSSALDLLRPDPPVDKPDVADKEPEEEDELEALRQAAIASMMKPKAPAYKVQAHPKRSNLLCIVVDDQIKPDKPLKSVRELMGNGAAGQLDPPKIQSGSPRRDKFNRYESGSDKDESEEEEEEVETETEVEVTDSEYEAEADSADQQKDKSDDLSTSATNNDEDVLNVDCREEVDEFSKFLNEFETELNDSSATDTKDASKSVTGGKSKKTKIIKKKKIVKRIVKKGKSKLDVSSEKMDKTLDGSATHHDTRRSRTISRSPSPLSRYGRRYSRSPMSPYRRSPPRRRSRSPYRRGLSPYSRRPYSPPQYRYGPTGSPPYRPGSPPPFFRRTSPPPYRRGSPPGQYRRYGSPHRRMRSPRGSTIRFEKNTFSRRGGSAPRTTPGDGEGQQRHGDDKNKESPQGVDGTDSLTKSKSLPPTKKPDNRSAARIAREEEERKKAEEKEEQKRLEFEERLKRLSSPDREKVLARRRKFENSQAMVKPEKKVISLKTDSSSSVPIPLPLETAKVKSENVGGGTGSIPAKKVKRLISEDQGDAISLSVDDTLDMFEEADESSKFKRGPLASRIGKREPEPPGKSITDLRVQLYKKRQQKRRDSDFDDSLENAVVESPDDVDDGDTVRTALSGNRIVKPPSRETERRIGVSVSTTKRSSSRSNSPIRSTKFVVRNVSPKLTSLKPSMIARLGDQVAEEDVHVEPEVEVSRKRKKTSSTGRSESPTSGGDEKSTLKMSKKEKKKEKKEKEKKKKSKKDKKEKREKRKKRKSKVSDDEDDDESPDEENNQPAIDVDAEPEAAGAGNSSDDEELWGFFEKMKKTASSSSPDVHAATDKTDILMDKMRKKNEARLKRIKEIEEDRMKYK